MKKAMVLSAVFASLVLLQGCASLNKDCRDPSDQASASSLQPKDDGQAYCRAPDHFGYDRI